MNTGDVVKRIAEMLLRYANEVGMRMIDDLRNPFAKIVVTREGGVGVAITDEQPHWLAYANSVGMSAIDRWEDMSKLAGQHEPDTARRIKLEMQAFHALAPAMTDQLAVEAYQHMVIATAAENSLSSLDNHGITSNPVAAPPPALRAARVNLPIWLLGGAVAFIGSIVIQIDFHSPLRVFWLESATGYAIGLMFFPFIICAFNRFRKPWMFVLLCAAAVVITYFGQSQALPQ
jgi:hypothetical protein